MSLVDELILRVKRGDSMATQAAADVWRWLERWNVPVDGPTRRFYQALWYGAAAARGAYSLAAGKLVWEPMIRARFHRVGARLRAEGLPFITGHARISVGNDCTLGHFNVHSGRWVDEPELVIGDHCAIAYQVSFTVNRRVVLGDHVGIAAHAFIADSDGHPTDPERRLTGAPMTAADIKPVTIGHRVWIGRGAHVLKGVTIGDGAVIASGGVVAGDVPSGALAMGVPARVIKSPW